MGKSAKTYIGLDFGAFSVKAAWVAVSGGAAQLQKYSELQIPPETKSVQDYIRPWLEKNGIASEMCALQLPGNQAVFQTVKLDSTDPRTARQAAEMEVSSYNTMSGETMMYDASEAPRLRDRRIIMALARPGAISSALSNAEDLHVKPRELLPSGIAAYNAMAAASRKTLADVVAPGDAPATLYVNIGHTGSDVVAEINGGVAFARSFPSGGRAFTDVIVRSRGVAATLAASMKHDAVLGSDEFGLSGAADFWLAQLQSAIAVFRGQFRNDGVKIARVVISGGGAQLNGFADYASSKLDIPVDVATFSGASSQYSVAYGLALAAAGLGRCKLSLLPQYIRDEVVFREKKPYWVAAGICAALALAAFIVGGLQSLAQERKKVNAESERVAKLQKVDEKMGAIRRDAQKLREFSPELMRMLQAGPLARELVALVADSINPDDWVSMICDEAVYRLEDKKAAEAERAKRPREMRRLPPAGSIGPGSRLSGKERRAAEEAEQQRNNTFAVFIIEGYTPDMELASVKELVRKLNDSGLVARADALGDEKVLPPSLLGEEGQELFGGLSRFVVRVEMNRP